VNFLLNGKMKKLIKNERGATAAEYAIMVALIAVAIFSAVELFGVSVRAAFESVSSGFEK